MKELITSILSINLIISLVMNRFNQSVQILER